MALLAILTTRLHIMRAQEFTEDHSSDINYDKAYDSFVSAEMRGVDKGEDGTGHYIRTYGANKKNDPVGYKKGSSAWGPAQINGTTAKDYTTRYPKKFKDQTGYTDQYHTQASQSIKYGREPNKPGYDKRHDYGGKGNLSAPEFHEPYQKMAKTIMRQMDHELKSKNPKANVHDLIKRWRGKSYDQDPEYYDAFLKTYNQQKDADWLVIGG